MSSHLYIHIPFCRQRCPYCKFALTPVFDEFKKKRYIEYLKKEIREYFIDSTEQDFSSFVGTDSELQKPQNDELCRNDKKLKTIYFGGGTPSVLSHDEIREILACFPFWTSPPFRGSQRGYLESTPSNLPYKGRNPEVENLEITMEMNPEDVTAEYIEGVVALGVNRISLGVQTLNEASLTEIHRSDRETIFGTLEAIGSILSSRGTRDLLQETDSPTENDKKYEISLNIDFILGLPFVQPGETLAGIRELHERFPYITHTSVYMLEDEKYPKHWRENSITEIEMQSEFLAIMGYLNSIGLHHYELSNWARPGYESVHNQAYWDHSEARGFGLSAASFEFGNRWNNSSSFVGYYAGKKETEEMLTSDQIEIENMMFGLRRDGWQYDGDSKKLDTLISDGLIEIHGDRIKPTKTGIFLLDHILSELI